jgi:hypothetical protein
MKKLLLLALVISVTCLFAKTVVDYDHAANFGQYRTYTWIAVNAQSSLWNDRVVKAVDEQLAARGWTRVDSGGDASISAVGSTLSEQTLETFFNGGFGGGWYHRGWWVVGAPGYSITTVEHTKYGTLHIDIFDTQTKKVIWHGVSTDALTGDPQKNEKKLDKDVLEMFKKLPFGVKG